MTIKYYDSMIQGTDEWHAVRCGLLTASEVKLIMTPKTLEYSSNEKERSHVYELAAQRITNYVEPSYVSDSMLRGQDDEILARAVYNKHFAKTTDCGFITNNKWGFTIGYSPDWLVSTEGQAEVKSRKQKFQVETIVSNEMPIEYRLQVQTGLLVTEREWCDFISYSGGMPMFTKRIFPDAKIQGAIISAATKFHEKLAAAMATYESLVASSGMIPTERTIEEDISL